MTNIHWARDLTGSFTNPANWTGGVVPGSADNAYIDAPGTTPYTVTVKADQTVGTVHVASTATLAINGVGVSLVAANLTPAGDTNTGVILIGDGAALSLNGYVTNAGRISMEGSTHATSLIMGHRIGVILRGGGSVVLGGPTNSLYGNYLDNVDNTISGAGFIDHNLQLKNGAAGVIDANAVGGIFLDTSHHLLTNDGLIEASGAGTLTIASTAIDQSGGGVIAAAGARVYLSSDEIFGGSVMSSGAGKVVVAHQVVLESKGSPVSVSGTLLVADQSDLVLQGAIANTGTITLAANTHATSLFLNAGGVTLSGGGALILSDRTSNLITDDGVFTVLTNVDNTITGAGLIGGDVGLTLVNQAGGIINANRTLTLTINTATNTVTNAGQIKATGAGGLVIDSPIANSGQITSTSGSSLMIHAAISNSGALVVNGGNLTVTGAVTGPGHVLISHGTLRLDTGFGENVKFDGVAGVLALGQSQTYGGTISGFSGTGADALDLLDIAFGATTKASYSGTTSGGTLTVTDGTHTAAIKFAGNYVNRVFTLSSDGHGGTTVVDPAPPAGPSAHAFIAAAAGLGGTAGSTALHPQAAREHPAALVAPHACVA